MQDDWGRNVSWPWTSVIQGVQNLYPKPRTVMVPALVARNLDLWCVPIVLVGVAYLAFSRKPRFPMEAWMLGVAMIVMGFSSSVLASFNRFVFADWVIFPAYAALVGPAAEVAPLSDTGRAGGGRHLDDVPDDRPLLGESLRRLRSVRWPGQNRRARYQSWSV